MSTKKHYRKLTLLNYSKWWFLDGGEKESWYLLLMALSPDPVHVSIEAGLTKPFPWDDIYAYAA